MTKTQPEAEVEKPSAFWTLINPLLAALQFLTVLPVANRRLFSLKELGQAVGLYPLVGLILGGLLLAGDALFSLLFPDPVRYALTLALWVGLTGALHLDGFLDACDGLFGGGTPEKRLAIMRDVNVGAFGLVGGVILLLVKFAALQVVPDIRAALLLAPAAGRWGMTLAIAAFPYAHAEGLGRAVKDHASWRQVGLGLLLTLPAAAYAGWLDALIVLAVAALSTWLVGRFVTTRIPGLTGDVYGALCELGEVWVLLSLIVLGGWR